VGTVFRDNVLRSACDKAIQVYGRSIQETTNISPTHPTYFDLQVLDNRFIDCKQPIRSTAQGRYLVKGNEFLVEDPGTLFTCDGPRFDGSDNAVYFQDNLLQGCRRGLRVSGSVHVIAEGNRFVGNQLRGVAMFESARGLFQNNRFELNGGSTSAEAYYGGLAVADTARVDAGGGSVTVDGQARTSTGFNVFLLNRSSTDASLDVSNLTTTAVRAIGNFWGDLDPSDQVEGDVVFTNFLSADPTSSGPPQAPGNLRRTDTP
jgi:parallel beta-helix repeat protein